MEILEFEAQFGLIPLFVVLFWALIIKIYMLAFVS